MRKITQFRPEPIPPYITVLLGRRWNKPAIGERVGIQALEGPGLIGEGHVSAVYPTTYLVKVDWPAPAIVEPAPPPKSKPAPHPKKSSYKRKPAMTFAEIMAKYKKMESER